jgi:hypothetical protein
MLTLAASPWIIVTWCRDCSCSAEWRKSQVLYNVAQVVLYVRMFEGFRRSLLVPLARVGTLYFEGHLAQSVVVQ